MSPTSQLRTASRVLIRLARFRALTFAELERRLRRVPWERGLTGGERADVRVTCRKSRFYHSPAVGERIERDLTERMGVTGAKASLEDDEAPGDGDTQLIVVRFDRDHCTISADSSGANLQRRAYRTSVTQTPMRETLAAAVVLDSGWDRRSTLIDPFCGSGTIPFEAALPAAEMAPGRNRRFRFMRWPEYSAADWQRVHAAALRRESAGSLPLILGSDRSMAALRPGGENAEPAGVRKLGRFEKRDAEHIIGGETPGWW